MMIYSSTTEVSILNKENFDPKLLLVGKVAVSSEAAALGSEQQTVIKRSQRPTTARGHRSIPKPQSFKE